MKILFCLFFLSVNAFAQNAALDQFQEGAINEIGGDQSIRFKCSTADCNTLSYWLVSKTDQFEPKQLTPPVNRATVTEVIGPTSFACFLDPNCFGIDKGITQNIWDHAYFYPRTTTVRSTSSFGQIAKRTLLTPIAIAFDLAVVVPMDFLTTSMISQEHHRADMNKFRKIWSDKKTINLNSNHFLHVLFLIGLFESPRWQTN